MGKATATATATTAVTLLVLVLAMAAADAMARPASKADMVKAHYMRLYALQKMGPQPRAVDVTHELKDVKPSELVWPPQTVLHRCDEVLCCGLQANPQDRECRPTVKTVTLYFHANELGSSKVRNIEHDFQNHTKCECVLKTTEGR